LIGLTTTTHNNTQQKAQQQHKQHKSSTENPTIQRKESLGKPGKLRFQSIRHSSWSYILVVLTLSLFLNKYDSQGTTLENREKTTINYF
jgi:hypothetical protein